MGTFSNTFGIVSNFTTLNLLPSVVAKLLYRGLNSEIAAGHMPNKVGSDYLTVSGSAGSETYQAPNTTAYKNADTDFIWFKTDASIRTTTTAELIGYDLPRTWIKYDNVTPYAIREILIPKVGETFTTAEMNNIRDYCQLSRWWDGTLSFHGVIKGNKPLQQQYEWVAETVSVSASGGTEYTVGGYKYHKFTSTDTLIVSNGGDVEVLAVAGGGGGGSGAGGVAAGGGGGGAGGVLYSAALTIEAGNITATVGGGGAGGTSTPSNNTKGQNSVFETLIAIGGGRGGLSGYDPVSGGPSVGGSGGGGGYNKNGAAGTAGQGNAGGNGIAVADYAAGGGGGAGSAGVNGVTNKGGNGGDGVNTYSDLLIAAEAGVDVAGVHWIAGGGGGGSLYSDLSYKGLGGKGGGGNGGGSAPVVGIANTGGGGGGGIYGVNGANGGSGIIIIRYAI